MSFTFFVNLLTPHAAFLLTRLSFVVQFLSMQGFPHQISQKLMSPPTTKLFTAIVQFLYGQFLDPSFQILKKFEEEIPRIFKDLR